MAAIAVAFGMPLAGNLAYVLGPTPGNFDLTTVGFAVTALTLALACLRWCLLDIVPIARDALVEHMRDGMIVIDGRGRLVDCNRAVRPLLGCSADEAIGRHVSEALPAGFDALRIQRDELLRAGPHRIEAHGSEGHRIFEVEVVELAGGAPSAGRLLLLHDVTARERLQDHLARQALTDDLTRIGNRRFFLDRIQRALVDGARGRGLLAVLFVDLDDFKLVNDTFGHECGDAVLAATARRLEQCIRPGDEVARLGGDEFAILLTNLDGEATAAQVADRIAASFRDPFELDGRLHLVSASMGLHVTDGEGCTPESLLSAADRGMYAAKRAARSVTEAPVLEHERPLEPS